MSEPIPVESILITVWMVVTEQERARHGDCDRQVWLLSSAPGGQDLDQSTLHISPVGSERCAVLGRTGDSPHLAEGRPVCPVDTSQPTLQLPGGAGPTPGVTMFPAQQSCTRGILQRLGNPAPLLLYSGNPPGTALQMSMLCCPIIYSNNVGFVLSGSHNINIPRLLCWIII